jgi:hypothetical protein
LSRSENVQEEVPEDIRALVSRIAAGQISVDDALAELDAGAEPEEPEEGFTIQRLKRNFIQATTGAKYLGSGTPLLKYLKTGEKPSGEIDRIALEHDIRYTTATNQKDVIDADKLFIKRLNALASRKSSISDLLLSFVAGPAMTVKRFLGSIPLSPVDAKFVDYEANAKLPEREVLLAIQDTLANDEILSERAVGFIFHPATRQALSSARVPQLEQEPESLSRSENFQEAPSLDPVSRDVPSLTGTPTPGTLTGYSHSGYSSF